MFKLVLYFDSTATSNQFMYYSTTNRGNFLKMLYSFWVQVCSADSLWLAAERAFTKNSRKSGM